MLEVSVPIAHELLAQCIKQGHGLVQRASLVGDFSDYEAWKTARKQWIEPTTHALEHMYGDPRQAREFGEAVTCPERRQRWQQQYAADLDCVKRAIELLGVLQGELAFEPGPAAGELAPGSDSSPQGADTIEQLPQTTASGAEPGAALEEHEPPVEALLVAEGPAEERLIAGRNADERRSAETNGVGAPALREDDRRSPAELRPVGAELARAEPAGVELAAPEAAAPAERGAAEASAARTRRVFLAHGRDERWKEAVAHLLEHAGSDEVTILNDRPEERAKLLEQIGEQAHATRYAIVLLTADDVGAARLESPQEPYFTTRARQDVVFEMGFLVAALTPGRVCVLYEDGVELPCELEGISHVRLDLAGTWQPKLLLALRRAGFDYDLNRLAAA